MNYEALLRGLQKWPERMTTSPSGRHLGIYKMLGKHVREKQKTPNPDQDVLQYEGTLQQGRDVLYLIFDIMSLAIKHTYPL